MHKRFFKYILITLFCGVFMLRAAQGQEIDFGSFDTYSLTVFKDQDLSFGNVMYDEGIVEVNLIDVNKSTISIEGVQYLDITVEITADNELLLSGNPANSGDPTKSIPFTLEAAYQNKGLPQSEIGAAELFSVSGNFASERFRILERQGGPPGPPPTPPHKGFTPPTETAYVYIYGSIDVGKVSAGPYSGIVNFSITYN